jgi:hypothetical protein
MMHKELKDYTTRLTSKAYVSQGHPVYHLNPEVFIPTIASQEVTVIELLMRNS